MRANHLLSRRGFLRVAGSFALFGGLAACTRSYVEDRVARPMPTPSAPTVFATTDFLGDIVRNVAPDALLTVMVGPGGNVSVYEPNTGDIARMQDSDLVLWTSPRLESLLRDQLAAQNPRQFAALGAVTDVQDLIVASDSYSSASGVPQSLSADPHVWLSPPVWKVVVQAVAERLVSLDPAKAEQYRINEDIYLRRIDEADAYVKEQVAAIPEGSRVLITGYDGFRYFGKHYGFEVHAATTAGLQAATQPDPHTGDQVATQVKALSDLVMERQVKALFPDNVAGEEGVAAVQQLVRSRGGQVGLADRELLVGSLGVMPPLDGYVGALRYNADQIRGALEAKNSHV